MSEELQILKLVTGRLAEASISYMVTGSMAVNYYAVPRMTRDIDIVVELSELDVNRAVKLFEKDFYVDPEMVQEAIKNETMFNLIHQEYVIKVDLIVRKDNEYRKEEFSRRRKATIDGHSFDIVAPEDLILSKLDWAKDSHSEMQLGDVRNLLSGEEDLDREYLIHWVIRLGLQDIYEESLR